MPGWTLFPKDKTAPSETASYTITYVEFHPCVRPDRRPSKSVTVRGHRAAQATRQALRDGMATVVRVQQRGR